MGVGYLIAVSVLISEIVGGCAKRCRQFARRNSRAVFSRDSDPSPSIRATYSDEPPISSQEKFRRIVFRRFRRNSERPASTITPNEAPDYRKKHTRSKSISIPGTSFGVSQSTVNERRESKGEPDIDEVSNQNESAKRSGSANRSVHFTADTEMNRTFTIENHDAARFKEFSVSSQEEFGEIVEHDG